MNSEYFSRRFEAVFLVCHRYGPKFSIAKAAKYMKKSEAFVRHWVEQWKREKNVNDRPNIKPNQATTSRQDQHIVNFFEENPGVSLRQAAQRLRRRNIQVSKSTIQKRLHEHRLKYRSTLQKPLLTDIHIKKRMRWGTENVHTDWGRVIFTDESSFLFSNPLTHPWCTADNRIVARTTKHPQKIHVYGAFCERGFGTLAVFTGILNAERMCNFYQRVLLITANKFYGTRNRDGLLLEDNDPKHRSRLCTWKYHQHGIQQMEWPPQSPDCNPIENVWSLMKARLKGKTFKNMKQFGAFLQRQWKSFPPEYAQNLSESMASRCARVIEKQGEWIKY